MGSSELNDLSKLHGSIEEAFTKLQNDYAELERKYNETSALVNNTSCENLDNFVYQLAKTVASLYGRSIYSDLKIKLKDKVMPVHKFVLHARSDVWHEGLDDTKEFDWTDIEEDVAINLLQWLYTDFISLPNDCMALSLLQVANRFQLTSLFAVCEQSLCDTVQKETCISFYCTAEEVGATALTETCSRLIAMNWNTFTKGDFQNMPGTLLYKMLKNKTKHILHEAIRLQRNDVVLLFLEDNINNANCLNTLSDEGILPMQLALIINDVDIIQTLMNSGKIDVNAVDRKGYTLLMDAIQRADKSAALYLLDKNCELDLQTRETGNTALHLICSYDMTNKSNTYLDMIDMAKCIISKGANVNIQNRNGQTPLHLAVQAIDNNEIFDLLLTASEINVNLLNNNEESALELLLMQANISSMEFAKINAQKLIDLGANCNQLKSASQDNLLQILASNEREDAAIFLAEFCDLNHLNDSGLTALHIAAERNLVKLIEKLLSLGAAPNTQNLKSHFNTPLHLAVMAKSINAVQVFGDFTNSNKSSHREIPDFNLQNADGNSPLSICLSKDQLDIMPILIKSGANVNIRNKDNMNLLHMAILSLNSEAAINLLDHGADLNAFTNDGESPLQLAIKCKLPKVVDALCSRDVTHLNAHNSQEECPLWIALELQYDDLAEILVKHGIDTNCWGVKPDSPYRQTLLHRAIEEGNEKAAIFLIKNHCNLDAPRNAVNSVRDSQDDDQACPIHLCCKFGAINVLKTLIYHGVYINALDAKGQTALHTAIRHQQNEVIMILLCHPNVGLEILDVNGYSAFAAALSLRNHKAAQQILDRFPNAAEQMNSKGRNFLHLAIMKEDLESVLFLLSIKVNVNSRVQDATQSTPMHLAAALKDEMILRNLILAEAHINERDASQKTCLHIAVEKGNLGIVAALLQNGADYDSLDNEYNNALHIAAKCGHLAIVRELLTESNINAEILNCKGRNPLHELCRFGEDQNAASICDLFMECMPKYPINATDMDGNTPLILAFMRGQVQLCKVLVKNGACLGSENHEGISIFNFKLATDQLLHRLLDQLPQESPWSESDHCQECNNKFSLRMRKHHCRHCGRVVCSKCSNNDVPILKFGINKPVRVCGVCFDVLQGLANPYKIS